MNWDFYFKSLGSNGITQRERMIRNAQRDLMNQRGTTLSRQNIKLRNCEHEAIIISTDNNNEKKIVMMPGDVVSVGEYIEWNNFKWIVSELNQDHAISYSGKILMCDLVLKWQDETGGIITRYCSVSQNSGYNLETEGKATKIDGMYIVTIPYDIDTAKLSVNRRFITWNGGTTPEVCKLIKINPIKAIMSNGLSNEQAGTLEITLEKDLYDPSSDNTELMIADYKDPTKPIGVEVILTCPNPVIKIGGSAKEITVNVSDGTWEVITPPGMENLFVVKTDEAVCSIQAKEDYSLLGTSVLVRCSYLGASSEVMLKVVSRI